jgi:hypothetical protein
MRAAASRNATVAGNDRVTDPCGLGGALDARIAARRTQTQSLRSRVGNSEYHIDKSNTVSQSLMPIQMQMFSTSRVVCADRAARIAR